LLIFVPPKMYPGALGAVDNQTTEGTEHTEI
jgi:hypothetical protein